MTDFTLSEGHHETISVNTTVENFVYEGGYIVVNPDVALFITDDFIFRPTTNDDAVGKVFGAFVARAAVETGYNGAFRGFFVYDTMPDRKPLFFPAIVFSSDDVESKITTDFFGGEFLESTEILCDLAFKANHYETVEDTRIGQKELAEHYLWYMRQILNDIKFESDNIKVGNLDLNYAIQEPMNPKQTLYGFSMNISVDFKKES